MDTSSKENITPNIPLISGKTQRDVLKLHETVKSVRFRAQSSSSSAHATKEDREPKREKRVSFENDWTIYPGLSGDQKMKRDELVAAVKKAPQTPAPWIALLNFDHTLAAREDSEPRWRALQALYDRAFSAFRTPEVITDQELLRTWVNYVKVQARFRSVADGRYGFKFLNAQGHCRHFGYFYTSWAEFEARNGSFKKAAEILESGLRRKAITEQEKRQLTELIESLRTGESLTNEALEPMAVEPAQSSQVAMATDTRTPTGPGDAQPMAISGTSPPCSSSSSSSSPSANSSGLTDPLAAIHPASDAHTATNSISPLASSAGRASQSPPGNGHTANMSSSYHLAAPNTTSGGLPTPASTTGGFVPPANHNATHSQSYHSAALFNAAVSANTTGSHKPAAPIATGELHDHSLNANTSGMHSSHHHGNHTAASRLAVDSTPSHGVSLPATAMSAPPPTTAASRSNPLVPAAPVAMATSHDASTADGNGSTAVMPIHFYLNGQPYTRLECIGNGGSSKVYKALTRDLKVVAIKEVKLHNADSATVEGYVNEIELLKRLQGKPTVITLLDSVVDLVRGAIYLVLEYGEIDLATVLKRGKEGLSLNHVRLYWQMILEAVQTIHDERIVHSDLKPANFVFVQGTLKLIDFGIAKAIQNNTTNIVRDQQVGTINYMSPESLVDDSEADNDNEADEGKRKQRWKLGRASDIWSLGCILYQMCYGAPPFAQFSSVLRKMQKISDPNYEIPYPKQPLGRNEALIDVMQRCLKRNPKERPTIPELLNHPFLKPQQ